MISFVIVLLKEYLYTGVYLHLGGFNSYRREECVWRRGFT